MLRNPVIELRNEQLAFGSVNCQHVSFLSMIMFLCSGQHQKLPESNIKKSALFQFKRPVMTKGCACHMPWWQMTRADSKRRHLWRFLYLEWQYFHHFEPGPVKFLALYGAQMQFPDDNLSNNRWHDAELSTVFGGPGEPLLFWKNQHELQSGRWSYCP